MADRETVINHLKLIHTWAASARECDLQFFTAKLLEDIAQWTDDAIALLKAQENKKLIDADKLREKLGFAEYCEDCKHDSWKCECETIYSLYDFCTAIDIAIEELMQEGR